MRRRWSCALPAALAAGLLAGVSLAAELVVVASTAPGLKIGEAVDSEAALDVPAGATVTLIGQDGKVTTLRGPFSGPPGGDTGVGEPGLVTALSALLAPSGPEATELGAVRGPAGEGPDGPWMIDISRPGAHCVPRQGPVVLWRPKTDKAASLSVKLGPGGQASTTPWRQGSATLAWPEDVPLRDGATYIIHLDGTVIARQLVLHLVPDELPSDAHRAVWMAEWDCRGQARLLLARLGAGEGPMGLHLSSDRGEEPVYRMGEDLVLLVRTEEDAYLNCFYRQAEGSLIKIFPNPYAESGGISGGRLHRIPGLTESFALTMTGPPGVEGVICFAADREVDRDLPSELAASNFAVLPAIPDDELAAAFHGVPAAKMSEAHLTVTVVE